MRMDIGDHTLLVLHDALEDAWFQNMMELIPSTVSPMIGVLVVS